MILKVLFEYELIFTIQYFDGRGIVVNMHHIEYSCNRCLKYLLTKSYMYPTAIYLKFHKNATK